MSVYVLHDIKFDSYISPADNFNRQWIPFIQKNQIVKFAPPTMTDFVKGDIVIIYMDNDKPYGQYTLIDGLVKVFITGKLTNKNINYLNDADYIVYINDIQKQITEEVYGIVKPSHTCPRHPLPSIDVNFRKRDKVFVGGILSYEKMDVLKEALLDVNRKYDKSVDVVIHTGGSGVIYKKNCDNLAEWLNKSELNGNRIVNVEFNKDFYNTFLLNIATSRYIHLVRSGPSVELVRKAIVDKDKSILDNPISESSMLSIAQRYDLEINTSDHISFLPYHENNQSKYDFRDFASDMLNITNLLK